MASETFKLALVLKAFDEVSAPLKKINDSIERFNAPLRKVNNAFKGLTEAAGFNKVGSALGNVGKAANGLGSAIFDVGKKFALIGGLAGAALGKMVYDTVESSSKLIDLHNATGASVESIQRLGFAFEQSGGNTEEFQNGLFKFTKNLGDARRHAGPLFQFLQKNNKPLLNKLLNEKDTGAALKNFVEYMSGLKTAEGRASVAALAVGKAGAKTFAGLAAEGLDNLHSKMAETPGVITEEQAARAENFGDVLHLLSRQFGAMTIPIVHSLIPALNSLSLNLIGFFKGNEQSVKDWAKDFGEKLPGRIEQIKQAFESLWEKLKPVRDFWNSLSGPQKMAVVLGVLSAVIFGPVLAAMASLTVAVVNLGIAMLTTPVGWITGVLLILSALLISMYSDFNDLSEMVGGFGNAFHDLGEDIKYLIKPLADLLSHLPGFEKFSDIVKTFSFGLLDFKGISDLKDDPNRGSKFLDHFTDKTSEVPGALDKNFRKINPLKSPLPFSDAAQNVQQETQPQENAPEKKKKKAFSLLDPFGIQDKILSAYSGAEQPTPPEAPQAGKNKNLTDQFSALGQSVASYSDPTAKQVNFSDMPSQADPKAMAAIMNRYAVPPSIVAPQPQVITKEASVTVKFENVPKGTRVERDPKSQAPLNLSLGYSMAGD